MGGILAPLALERMGRDPAVSSSVFVTFLTDFMGFFALLGIAALILLVRLGVAGLDLARRGGRVARLCQSGSRGR